MADQNACTMIEIVDDREIESTEHFFISIVSDNPFIDVTDKEAVVTILDDDDTLAATTTTSTFIPTVIPGKILLRSWQA